MICSTVLLITRFSREIPHFFIHIICLRSIYCGSRVSLVWKIPCSKFSSSLWVNTRWNVEFKSKKLLQEFVSLILAFVCICSFPKFQNASMVYICEIMIDIIKHSFIAKFNDIKPIVFSEFLEDLYRQVYLLTIVHFLLLQCAGIKIVLNSNHFLLLQWWFF